MTINYDQWKEAVEGIKGDTAFVNRYNNFADMLNSGVKFKSAEIEKRFGMNGAEVRQLVNFSRRQGILICSGNDGYWIGTPLQSEDTIKHLQQRIDSMQAVISGMKDGSDRSKNRYRSKKMPLIRGRKKKDSRIKKSDGKIIVQTELKFG